MYEENRQGMGLSSEKQEEWRGKHRRGYSGPYPRVLRSTQEDEERVSRTVAACI